MSSSISCQPQFPASGLENDLRKHPPYNAFDGDLSAWENSADSLPLVRTSSWLFMNVSTFHICEPTDIHIIKADRATVCALAVFDTIYTFWEERFAHDKEGNPNIRRVLSYHRGLRHRILGALLHSEEKLDVILQPWLMRTLCLYGHDTAARNSFRAVFAPSYLVDDVILHIINHTVFVNYVARFAGPVAAIPAFQCGLGERSWEALGCQQLPEPQFLRAAVDSDKTRKGIFLYPHERQTGTCLAVRESIGFQRGGITALPSSMARLNAGQWLNDEIINSYIALFDGSRNSDILVLTTFAYAKFSSRNRLSSKQLRKKDSCLTVQQAVACYELIVMPVNWENTHWLAVVLDVEKTLVTFMDSFPAQKRQECGKQIASGRVEEIWQVLKCCLELGNEWNFAEGNVPRQENSYDCGVFCAQFMKFAYLKVPIPLWREPDIVEIRDMMTLELFEENLRCLRQ